jgi:hypothetical protein
MKMVSPVDASRRPCPPNATGSEALYHNKLCLTISEAVAYSGLSRYRIASMLKEPNCPFVLYVGSKKMVKRAEFDHFIHNVNKV